MWFSSTTCTSHRVLSIRSSPKPAGASLLVARAVWAVWAGAKEGPTRDFLSTFWFVALGADPQAAYAGMLSAENAFASGLRRHSRGENAFASGLRRHSRRENAFASGLRRHSRGENAFVSGLRRHSRRENASVSGLRRHSRGENASVSGLRRHSRGENASASGLRRHSRGENALVSGLRRHVERRKCVRKRLMRACALENQHRLAVYAAFRGERPQRCFVGRCGWV